MTELQRALGLGDSMDRLGPQGGSEVASHRGPWPRDHDCRGEATNAGGCGNALFRPQGRPHCAAGGCFYPRLREGGGTVSQWRSTSWCMVPFVGAFLLKSVGLQQLTQLASVYNVCVSEVELSVFCNEMHCRCVQIEARKRRSCSFQEVAEVQLVIHQGIQCFFLFIPSLILYGLAGCVFTWKEETMSHSCPTTINVRK